MAEFVCSKCGYTKDTRCKPKVCPECDAGGSFEKLGDAGPAAKKPAAKKTAAKKPAAKKAK